MDYQIRTYSDDDKLVATRREQIAHGAARVFVRKGFQNTNVNEIAEACSMSKGNLYHYIGSKEDILFLVVEYGLAWVDEVCEKIIKLYANESFKNALETTIDMMCRSMDEKQDITLFCLREVRYLDQPYRHKVYDMEEKLIKVIEGLLARGNETDEFAIDDVSMVANDIVVDIQMWAFRRRFLNKRYTLDKYIKSRTRLIFKLVGAEKR